MRITRFFLISDEMGRDMQKIIEKQIENKSEKEIKIKRQDRERDINGLKQCRYNIESILQYFTYYFALEDST